MGRVADLFGEVAAAADEGAEGLVLPPDAWDRLRQDWSDEDIQDALGLVQENLLQSELVDAADSLNARMIELLGTFGEAAVFETAAAGGGRINLETLGHLARRVHRLEEILEAFREGAPPERRGFDALRRRLADHGIEDEMRRGRLADDDGEDG